MDSVPVLKPLNSFMNPSMNQPPEVLLMKDFRGHETHPNEDRLLETDSFR